MQRTTKLLGATLAACIATAACSNESVNPATKTLADPLFERYVSMGNSLTAGLQSGGINDSTQLRAYPVLLAQQMGTVFFDPLMNRPGCPAPYTNIFTGTRVGGASAPPCSLRATQPVPPPYINNTAVPGATVLSGTDNLDPQAAANALTTFFLGGLTQSQMMMKVNPTFVTVWLGNNDVLGAATDGVNPGDTTEITDTTVFKTRYAALLDSITKTDVQGAVLIGTAEVTAIPFFSAGQTYFGARQLVPSPLPDSLFVDFSCAPSAFGGKGDSVLIPFPVAGPLLATAAAKVHTTLYCFDTLTIRVVSPREFAKLNAAVASYNTFIAAQATAKGWAYWDPNTLLDSLRGSPAAVAPIPAFGAPCSANPFGTAFSCDGIHPSSAAHKLGANDLIGVINTKYGTTLARVP